MPTVVAPNHQTFELPPRRSLTVSADAVSSGTVIRLGDAAGSANQGLTSIVANGTQVFGPFAGTTRFDVIPSAGALTVTEADAFPAPGRLLTAHAILDFSVSGGAISTITPPVSDLIPDNAILVAATINSTTAVTSLGSATVAVGTSAGSSTTSILGATAKTSLTLDAVLNGACTFAAPVKLTAAGQITFTIGTAALTAGVIEVWVLYYVANA